MQKQKYTNNMIIIIVLMIIDWLVGYECMWQYWLVGYGCGSIGW